MKGVSIDETTKRLAKQRRVVPAVAAEGELSGDPEHSSSLHRVAQAGIAPQR